MTTAVASAQARTDSGSEETSHLPIRRDEIDAGAIYATPEGELENVLARIVRDVLGIDKVGRNDSFFELGGDSLQAVDLFARIEQALDVRFSPSTLIEHPTVAQIAALLAGRRKHAHKDCLVTLQPRGPEPALFLIHDLTGHLFSYRDLLLHLGSTCKIYGIQYPGHDSSDALETTLPRLAADYVDVIKSVQPSGPYFLIGYSFGGTAAYEIARQLRARGDDIGLLASIDGGTPHARKGKLQRLVRKLAHHLGEFEDQPPSAWPRQFRELVRKEIGSARVRRQKRELAAADTVEPGEPLNRALFRAHATYEPQSYDGAMKLFACINRKESRWFLRDRGWKAYVQGPLEIIDTPADHYSAIKGPAAAFVACHITTWVNAALNRHHTP